jgi:hypothetical protein
MRMSSENHYVTPTYQSLLILGIDTVARRLADKEVLGAWQALETLYVELPPDCQKECNKSFEKVKKDLKKIYNYKGYTFYEVKRHTDNAKYAYLVESNLRLFNIFKNSLFAKGYLESAPIKPRNSQPSPLGE